MDNTYSQLMQSLITSTKVIFPDNKVIRGNLNGGEPSNPYVAITVVRDTQIGISQQSTLLDTANNISIRSDYSALVQFSFNSVDEEAAGDMVKKFVQYLNVPLVREAFRRNKLSKLSVSPIRNVAQKRETTWIQSYNVDVTFIYSTITVSEMTPIEIVELTDDISGTVYTVPPDVIIP